MYYVLFVGAEVQRCRAGAKCKQEQRCRVQVQR